MPEFGFYHLSRTPMPRALSRLLGRTLQAGERALVSCRDHAQVEALDVALWLSKEHNWLPHGTAVSGHAPDQPIWLSTVGEAVNGARFLFLVDATGQVPSAGFKRVFDVFDGNLGWVVAAARLRWQAASQAGLAPSYWQEGLSGWERKAG